MMEAEKILTLYEPLKKCIDSMLFDSGTEIAAYGTDECYVMLDVHGDVRVHYKGCIYRHASDMPEELLAMFADGSWTKNKDVEVIDNNWFDVSYVVTNSDYESSEDFVFEDDLSEMDETALAAKLDEYLQYFEKNIV